MPGERRRTEYLLDGHRVTVRDLVEGGLLEPDVRLSFSRPQLDWVEYAYIDGDNNVVLERSGEKFRALSRAATVAAGVRAVDGWHAWRVAPNGPFLDELRQKLLENVAAEASEARSIERGADDQDAEGVAQQAEIREKRQVFLSQARVRAHSGDPAELTVEELLRHWGADGRSEPVIERIGVDLENRGLRTVPDFRKVALESTIRLQAVPAEPDLAPDLAEISSPSSIGSADPVLEIGLSIGNFPFALKGLVSVKPQASFEEAVTMMLLDDFTQLAVMSSPSRFDGAVSWQSIAKARHQNPSATLKDAIFQPPIKRYDEELLDVLPDLSDSGFVLVRNDRDRVEGIVTTADVVDAYRDLATPFLLIGELDRLLRRVVDTTFDLLEIIAVCDPDGERIAAIDDLTMGDYQRMLQNPAHWETLGWPLDRVLFDKRLGEIRNVRNDVTHFNPDPLDADAITRLRHFLTLVRTYAGDTLT